MKKALLALLLSIPIAYAAVDISRVANVLEKALMKIHSAFSYPSITLTVGVILFGVLLYATFRLAMRKVPELGTGEGLTGFGKTLAIGLTLAALYGILTFLFNRSDDISRISKTMMFYSALFASLFIFLSVFVNLRNSRFNIIARHSGKIAFIAVLLFLLFVGGMTDNRMSTATAVVMLIGSPILLFMGHLRKEKREEKFETDEEFREKIKKKEEAQEKKVEKIEKKKLPEEKKARRLENKLIRDLAKEETQISEQMKALQSEEKRLVANLYSKLSMLRRVEKTEEELGERVVDKNLIEQTIRENTTALGHLNQKKFLNSLEPLMIPKVKKAGGKRKEWNIIITGQKLSSVWAINSVWGIMLFSTHGIPDDKKGRIKGYLLGFHEASHILTDHCNEDKCVCRVGDLSGRHLEYLADLTIQRQDELNKKHPGTSFAIPISLCKHHIEVLHKKTSHPPIKIRYYLKDCEKEVAIRMLAGIARFMRMRDWDFRTIDISKRPDSEVKAQTQTQNQYREERLKGIIEKIMERLAQIEKAKREEEAKGEQIEKKEEAVEKEIEKLELDETKKDKRQVRIERKEMEETEDEAEKQKEEERISRIQAERKKHDLLLKNLLKEKHITKKERENYSKLIKGYKYDSEKLREIDIEFKRENYKKAQELLMELAEEERKEEKEIIKGEEEEARKARKEAKDQRRERKVIKSEKQTKKLVGV